MADASAQVELQQILGQRLRGEVRFDPYSRALYSTDASNHQVTPLGVVFPESEEDLFAVVETAAELGVPLLPRGGGTSLSGSAVGEALILDCSKHLTQIHNIDTESQTAIVGPGVVCNQLNAAAAEHGLMYGPDPASADRATFGGMIGTNATGAHSIRYGMTADHVLAIDSVLSDGTAARFEETTVDGAELKAGGGGLEAEIYAATLAIRGNYAKAVVERWPRTWRRSSGYSLNYLTHYTPDRPAAWYEEEYPPKSEFNLAPLLCGSEGT
ncbi:MAG: FAD-binding oxidoreductase, partial [Anaerolineales bacterium]